jgi:hypothetical protein
VAATATEEKKRKTIEYVFYLDSLNVQATHRCTLLRIQGGYLKFFVEIPGGRGSMFCGQNLKRVHYVLYVLMHFY